VTLKGAASGRLMFSLLGGELNFINLGRSDDPGLEDDLVYLSVGSSRLCAPRDCAVAPCIFF
jgi:hypothetical protein